jgi:multicomponent Na+:H+ antiporter subunit C
MLYISFGKIANGTAPILSESHTLYANPLPHVLILTAIVVGVATTALGLALVVRIKDAFGAVDEETITLEEEKEE